MMWKILGLLVFCVLLGPSVGTVPGIKSVFSKDEFCRDITSVLTEDDLLKNHLTGLGLSDINLGGLLSLVGNIVGLKIVNVKITVCAVVFLPDKVEVNLSIHLGITGNAHLAIISVIDISLDIHTKIVLGFEILSEGILDVLFYECGCTFGAIDINLLGGLLQTTSIIKIQESIIADINLQICSILRIVFGVLKVKLFATANVDLSLGVYGILKIHLSGLPIITDTCLGLNVHVDLLVAGTGEIISIPKTATPMPLPPLENHRHCHAIHPALLNILLTVLSPKQPWELSCTPDAYSKADELRAAILALIPAGGFGSSFTNILYLKCLLLAHPVIAFEATGGIVLANVEIQFFLKNADGSILSILIVRISLSLKADLSVLSSRLHIGVSISKITLVLVSSGVGIIDVSSLFPHCNDFLVEFLLPIINGALAVGLPLPSPLGSVLVNVSIKFFEGCPLLCV